MRRDECPAHGDTLTATRFSDHPLRLCTECRSFVRPVSAVDGLPDWFLAESPLTTNPDEQYKAGARDMLAVIRQHS